MIQTVKTHYLIIHGSSSNFCILYFNTLKDFESYGGGTWIRTGDNAGMNRVL